MKKLSAAEINAIAEKVQEEIFSIKSKKAKDMRITDLISEEETNELVNAHIEYSKSLAETTKLEKKATSILNKILKKTSNGYVKTGIREFESVDQLLSRIITTSSKYAKLIYAYSPSKDQIKNDIIIRMIDMNELDVNDMIIKFVDRYTKQDE